MEIYGVDLLLAFYAVLAFVIIGLGLAAMILFTKAKFVSNEACKIKINHDDSMTKTVRSGTTLLSALTQNDIPIPSPCGGKATCKQCKVQIVQGAEAPLETDKGSFTKKQLMEGWRLSCQSKVKHDISVNVDESCLSVKEFKGKVLKNENVATFIKELVIELPDDEEFSYKSGEYLQVHVPPFKTNTNEWKETMEEQYWEDWGKFSLFDQELDFNYLPREPNEEIRAYSMASHPAEGHRLLFNIRIATPPFVNGKLADNIPWGIASSYTFSLRAGDEIKLSGPFGESYMIDDDRELVFLIGGAGSSFGRSHILHLFNTEKTNRKVTMWYGARSLKENIYQEEYEKLDAEHENFAYKLVLSEPLPEDFEEGWPKDDPVKTNYLFRAFELGQLKNMEEPEECLYYVCGPPMHNKSVMKLLDDYGVPRDNIVLDDFGN